MRKHSPSTRASCDELAWGKGRKGLDRAMLLGVLLLLWASLIPARAGAIPEYSRDLPLDLKNFCNVCHERSSGGPLNGFGVDYARFGRNMEAVSGLDSDGDGYTNADELAAGTFPGDPDSFPAAPKRGFTAMVLLAGSLLLVVALIYKVKRG